MVGVGGLEAGFFAVVPLLLWALALLALYWAVRTGVRHGLLDAERRRVPPPPGAPGAGGPPRGGE